MKRLLITLLLISPASFADWGDVYYCQMTNLDRITLEGEQESYKVQKFQFKLDKTKNAMVFGSSGYLGDLEMELRKGANWPSIESWYADSRYASTYFANGKFLLSRTGGSQILSISADCDKF